MKKILLTISLFAAVGLTTALGQTAATWTGTGGDGLWNNAANWDVGVPAEGTNAIIANGNTVNYNAVMSATEFAGVLVSGGSTLNVNNSGFNMESGAAANAVTIGVTGSSGFMNLNSGGAVTLSNSGPFYIGTNGVLTINAGGSLTTVSSLASDAMLIGDNKRYGSSSYVAKLLMEGGTATLDQRVTIAGSTSGSSGIGSQIVVDSGTLNLLGGARINNTSDDGGCRLLINGGTANIGGFSVYKSNPNPAAGLVISNGIVNATAIQIGVGNSRSYGAIYDGVLTNTGTFTVSDTTIAATSGDRKSHFVMRGGTVVSTTPEGIIVGNQQNASAASSSSIGGFLDLSGGTLYANGITLVKDNTIANAYGTLNLSGTATVYLGSVGLVGNTGAGSSGYFVNFNAGGTLGAMADYAVNANINMPGATTFQAADADGTSHDISVNGAIGGAGALIKTGGGTLTFNGTNTYTGNTTISNGVLALGATGALPGSLQIFVTGGANFDVSAAGFTLGAGKTIAGIGTVVDTAANFTAGDSSTVSPNGIGDQGTLNFNGGLSVSNANFNMELGNDPTGVSNPNDKIVITGDLNASGTNIIAVTPVGSLGVGTYKLITYTGSFNGDISNFSCVAGILTNDATAKEIDLIVSVVRPVANLIWRGDGSANVWDTGISSNWLNGASLDRFYTADTNNFDDSATNFVVDISGTVNPAPTAAVMIDATNDYTFIGDGDISGTTGLTKTNSGKLTILNANDYTGITTIGGGTLSVTNLENAGNSSSIGAAGSAAENIVFNGGALEYQGPSKSINRSATLETNGGTLSITNSTVTLTLSGSLTGAGSLTKIGNGQLTLSSSSDYSGGTIIQAGTLRTAQGSGVNISALGSGALTLDGQTNGNAATFLFGGDQETLNNTLNVLGTNNFVQNNGNDTLSSLSGNGTVYLEGTSGNTLTLQSADMSAFTGTLFVDTVGNLRFLTGSSVQDLSGGTINLGQGSALLNNKNGNLTVLIGSLFGGSASTLQGSSSQDRPSTYVIGGNNLDSAFGGSITEVSPARVVNLIKTGTGTLTFIGGVVTNITSPDGFTEVTNVVGTNLLQYTGTTTISNGVLALVVPDVLTKSPTITLAAATAVLDASQMGYISNQYDSDGTTLTNVLLFTNGIFEVVSGQTLAGVGTILASNVLADSGSILSPGVPVGTLNVNHQVELAGAVNMNVNASLASNNCSKISASTIVVDGTATLTVNNIGPEAGATFHLFNQAVTGFTAGVNLTLPALSGTNLWANNLAVDGTITLEAPPLATVNTNSTNIVFSVSGNALTLSWPSDHTGWRLQVQTNSLATGLNVDSNAWFDVAGSTGTNAVTIPVNPDSGSVFYRMVYP
ncbi:MAG TPA: autotransporter-associated beta strand repeat-containing protein [Verrucomicrobiae bacterium]|nr:autotransporter-associated beta strand repeat-containing protein [Verrucomicrobiae bacterium]